MRPWLSSEWAARGLSGFAVAEHLRYTGPRSFYVSLTLCLCGVLDTDSKFQVSAVLNVTYRASGSNVDADRHLPLDSLSSRLWFKGQFIVAVSNREPSLTEMLSFFIIRIYKCESAAHEPKGSAMSYCTTTSQYAKRASRGTHYLRSW